MDCKQGCGFYVKNKYADLDGYLSLWSLGGTAYLWGAVVEHEEGYRGEYARIYSLVRNNASAILFGSDYDELLKKLGDKYNVPIFLEESMK